MATFGECCHLFAPHRPGVRSSFSKASLVAQLAKNCLQCRRPRFGSWVGKIHWRRDRLPTRVFLGFPGGSAGKESTRNAGDLGSIPGLGRSPGEGKGYPHRYSGLENSMDCIVHGVAKSWTRLSDFHFLFNKACRREGRDPSFCPASLSVMPSKP